MKTTEPAGEEEEDGEEEEGGFDTVSSSSSSSRPRGPENSGEKEGRAEAKGGSCRPPLFHIPLSRPLSLCRFLCARLPLFPPQKDNKRGERADVRTVPDQLTGAGSIDGQTEYRFERNAERSSNF
uniref:Uncharacterized protein n=2 Tax=Bursaphelenchus xylophilus TaxID=6326 RepID=A0A1I7RU00_BURXY